MPTIIDVAVEAGVSVATVSRVLNGKTNVNPELARRVHAASGKLGYRPNSVARSLRRRSSDVIALIINDVGDPFFTAITRGVEDVAQRSGFSVLLCNTDEDADKEAKYLKVVEQEQVAGVILSPHSASSDVSRLIQAAVPLVAIDRTLDEPVDSVMVQSREGARRATDHLIDAGWKRPACISGPSRASTAHDRLEGYLESIRRHSGFEELYALGAFSQRGGAEAAATLLDAPTPPDALFVANAYMALGALEEIQRRGLHMGEDIGVIAFDNAPWTPFTSPPMSVVAQPAYDVGRQAAQLLMDRIRSNAPQAGRAMTLSTSLIIRASSQHAERSAQYAS